MSGGVPSTEAPGRHLTPWQRAIDLQSRFPILQVIALLGVYAYGAATLEGLLSLSAIRSILVLASFAGLAAMGQTLLILMGGFDMSVPGFIIMGALTVTTLYKQWGLPFVIAIILTVICAGIVGGFAGQVCHRLNIPPLIMTLATGAIALGVVQAQTGGTLAGGAPVWLSDFTSPAATTFGVPIPPMLVLWIVAIIIMSIFLGRTVTGRRLMATGANMRAAEYALVKTRLVWTASFAFSAVMSVLVGILLAGFAGSVGPTLGNPYLFQGVAAVIVGGTFFGGPGDYTRTVIGSLFLTVLTTVLVAHGASAADKQILYGAIILVAVTLYGRDKRLRDRI